jgi:hypothetical protein
VFTLMTAAMVVVVVRLAAFDPMRGNAPDA